MVALSVWIVVASVLALSINPSMARSHYHKHKSSAHHKYYAGNQISLPPETAPAEPPAPSKDRNGPCVFDVRLFGAIGDGAADDTKAFRSAWKVACAAESGVLLVPSDGVFMITSTIFSGPCKPGFTLQVSLQELIKLRIILSHGYSIMVLWGAVDRRSGYAAGRTRLLAGGGQQEAVAGVLPSRRHDFDWRRHHRGQRRGVVESAMQTSQSN